VIFSKNILQKKDNKSEGIPSFLFPVRIIFVGQKLRTIEEWRENQRRFQENIVGNKVLNPKNVPG
jgi:hypothetical protein